MGETYLESFSHACRAAGIQIVATERIAQTAQEVDAAVRRVRDAKSYNFV